MATSIPIDDDLLGPLHQAASRSGVPIAVAVNDILRGHVAPGSDARAQDTTENGSPKTQGEPFVQRPLSMSKPLFDVTKAIDFLNDEEDRERMERIRRQHEAR